MPQPDDTTILIAHTDSDMSCALAVELDADGYRVLQASTPATTAQLLADELAILLLGTVGKPGATAELLRELRAGALDCPAVLPVLTFGASDTVTQLRAYEAGSDHHLPTDVGYVLLRGIIAAVVRRCTMRERPAEVIEVGPLVIDTAQRQVRVDGELVTLTRREFELLCALATEPTRVFTKQQLLEDIWGYPDGRTRTLDSHACRLRRRLCAHAQGHELVKNCWGQGYSLLEPAG